MGKATGFMEFSREVPTRGPPAERIVAYVVFIPVDVGLLILAIRDGKWLQWLSVSAASLVGACISRKHRKSAVAPRST